MPKYTNDMIAGYYLYFTSSCTVEAMHVHASNKELTEKGSANFWVGSDGSSKVEKRGRLSDKSVRLIQEYIRINYKDMYIKWSSMSSNGFYNNI